MDWLWIIIVAVAALAQGWSKLRENAEESAPTPAPKPRPQRPRPIRPKLEPAGARRPEPKEWRVEGETVRKFFEQLQGDLNPPPIVVPPPMVRLPSPPIAPTTPKPPSPPPSNPTPAVVKLPQPPERAPQWAGLLRNRRSLRHFILSAEILGPPKSLQN